MSKAKESCPKCNAKEIAMATDKSNKRYCQACRHVWIPGATDKIGLEGQLKEAKALIQEQLIEISRLRKRIEETDLSSASAEVTIFE